MGHGLPKVGRTFISMAVDDMIKLLLCRGYLLYVFWMTFACYSYWLQWLSKESQCWCISSIRRWNDEAIGVCCDRLCNGSRILDV